MRQTFAELSTFLNALDMPGSHTLLLRFMLAAILCPLAMLNRGCHRRENEAQGTAHNHSTAWHSELGSAQHSAQLGSITLRYAPRHRP